MSNSKDVDLASEESFPASDPPPWTLGTQDNNHRTEHDSMGDVSVPADALYGAQTQRALENFPFPNHRLQSEFIQAVALIKACAARVNGEAAIACAADEIASGTHADQFPLSVFQTGSGTSTNMNVNEVIGRLANAHPNDDVNRGQSSNDVIPSAIHVSAALAIHHRLLPAMEFLHTALDAKAKEFADVFKIGRTHLQDATPITLGQEFSGYAHQLQASRERIQSASEGLYELALGGTAVGTGVNAPAGFAQQTIALIAERTGLPFREARNHFEAQAAKDAVLFLTGALKTYAIALHKIANDIRWLGSGPRAGLGELHLSELQPGSSIMPGKVNPVIPESVLMVCAQVIGHDAAITWACAAGNFELNTMMPLMAFDLLDSLHLLTTATENFATRCIGGLEADRDRTSSLVERSLANATMLAPEIGYEKAAALAKEAHATNRSIREVAKEKSGLSDARIIELLRLS